MLLLQNVDHQSSTEFNNPQTLFSLVTASELLSVASFLRAMESASLNIETVELGLTSLL